ncbi:MAG: hypothetical protein KDD60_03470 [Bdellovibrionales bacterium]|nr:hypothetical protein [Bdellovibrionales bacterium]
MNPDQTTPSVRNDVRKAITHYARFYALLASDLPGEAEAELHSLKNLDSAVRERVSESEFTSYFEKRSQLMRIFRTRLLEATSDQLQENVLLQAQRLVEKLEVIPRVNQDSLK